MSDSNITRRNFLKTSAWASALFAATPFRATGLAEPMPAAYLSPLPVNIPLHWTVPAALADTDPVVLALNRLAFGPRPRDVERVRAMGVDAFIEQQLAPETIGDAAVEEMLRVFPSLNMDIPELFKYYALPFMQNAPQPANNFDVGAAVRGFLGLFEPKTETNPTPQPAENRDQSVLELVQATVLRQVYSERQLFEVMVDFWSNHFNIYILKSQCRILKTWDDRAVIRKHALGKFRDLLYASAHSPAMLVYLDNVTNVKGVAQENYARELLELHTLGVDGGYTQSDVQNVARAFTGWSAVGPRDMGVDFAYAELGDFLFRKNQHDDGAKTVLGKTLAAGGGVRDGEQVLDLLAAHPKTAEYIAFKLVRRFVDDNPPASLVARAAEAFTQNDGEIRAVLDTILRSDEFKTSFGKKVKRPLEFTASALRALDATPTNAELKKVSLKNNPKTNPQKKRQPGESLARVLRALGQVPFLWQAPNGYPDVAGAWINSNNLLTRWNFALALTRNRVLEFEVALDATARNAAPDALVDTWGTRVLQRALPDADRAKLIAYAEQDHSAQRVENLVALLLASPHFQYR
ncbi:MAG: DUF1800 domain-containing protein [Chloroflexi bacterium]|nr:DUF1800 domain-containing protein [Chloroflexota bacterium]